MKDLAVVVVNWNTGDLLMACLASLLEACAGVDADIVVVDNASTDGSAAMVRERFPEVRLIESETNLGFARGNNLGISQTDAQHVLLLNPDVVVPRDAITGMMTALNECPRTGAVGAVLVGEDGAAQSIYYRRSVTRLQVLLFYTVLGLFTPRIGVLRRRWLEHDLTGQHPVEVDQLPGACIMVRREVLTSVGLLDPEYFIWFEDVDWCSRMRRAGYRLLALPDLRVLHHGGASFETWSSGRRLRQFRESLILYLKKSGQYRLAAWAAAAIRADLRVAEALVRAVPFLPRLLGRELPNASEFSTTRRAVREVLRHTTTPVSLVEARQPPSGERSVDVAVVNWNGRNFLPECLRALRGSTVEPRIILVDNDSSDGSAGWVREHHPKVHLVALSTNLGYAGGANVAISRSTARYVLVMNPDVRLAPDHLERLVVRMEADPTIGIAQGRLRCIGEEDFVHGKAPREKVLDSAGHSIRRSRMVADRGQGELETGRWNEEQSVFSASGASILLRREMLNDVAPNGNAFDPVFFAYKEDIDLSWRARLLGWDVRYIPQAIGWHVRGTPGPGRNGRGAPARARRHSWMNHWLMILKNDRLGDIARDLPWMLGWEAVRAANALIRDPALLPAYITVWTRVPGTLAERRWIQARRRTSASELRKWFGADAFYPRVGAVQTIRGSGPR